MRPIIANVAELKKAAPGTAFIRYLTKPGALFLRQELPDLVLMDNALLEGIGAGLGAAYGPDDLCPVLCLGSSFGVFGLNSGFRGLCHSYLISL